MHTPARFFSVTLLTATTTCLSCGPGEPPGEPVDRARQAYGEPAGDFPSHDERVTIVEINRVRADPNHVEAFTAGDCSPHRDPVPPVSYNLDLAQAARFFASYIGQSGCPLGHYARCTLRADLEGSGCDGSPACACEPSSDCGSCDCGSGPPQRATIFGFTGGSIRENGAEGHSVPQFAVWDWASECGSAPHRMTLTAPEVNVVGTGTVEPFPNQGTRFADFGSLPGWQTPRIPAASHYTCEWTKVGGYSYSCVAQILFRANYYDPAGDPQSLHVVLDGACLAMQPELGTSGNRTYKAVPDSVADGCHEYYFVAVDHAGDQFFYPDVGSLTFGTCGDGYVGQQAASSCSPGAGGSGGASGSGGAGGSGGGNAETGGSTSSTGGSNAGGSSGNAGGSSGNAGTSGAGGGSAAEGGNGAGTPVDVSKEPSSCACSVPWGSAPSSLARVLALLAVTAATAGARWRIRTRRAQRAGLRPAPCDARSTYARC